jgi:hypothetical protein
MPRTFRTPTRTFLVALAAYGRTAVIAAALRGHQRPAAKATSVKVGEDYVVVKLAAGWANTRSSRRR